MFGQISMSDNSGKSWTVNETLPSDELFKAAGMKPDGGDQLAATGLGDFDARNARAVGQSEAQRRAAEASLPTLKRNAKCAARHLGQTRPTLTIMTHEKLAELPWFPKVEAIVSMIGAIIAIAANNGVLTSYVVNSGNDLYANDRFGTHLFGGLAILVALGIRTFEHWLPSDTARDRYAAVFFAIGICTFVVWATATAKTFAPNASSTAWLTAGTDGGWAGIALVLAHVLGDAAWGYLLIAGAEKVLLGNRRRIEIENRHYAVAELRAKKAADALRACLNEIAEAEAFLAAVAYARIKLQGRLELELDLMTARWRAQREAGDAVARAHFLNTKG